MIFPTAVQERDGDQEIPLSVSHEPFVLNAPSERGSEAPIQHYQQEADVERPTGVPSEQASGDHVGGGASDPIQSDRPEREYQQPRDVLLNIESFSCGENLWGWCCREDCPPSGRGNRGIRFSQSPVVRHLCSLQGAYWIYCLKSPFDKLTHRKTSPLEIR